MVMRSRAFRGLTAFLLLCFLMSGEVQRGGAVLAKPSKSSEEEELEQQREDTLDEIRSLKSDINSVEQKIRELESTRSSLQSYIRQLDEQVNEIASRITELERKIEEKKEEIAQKEEELKQAEAEVDARYELMKKRICYMYERGEDSFLMLFLESGSIAELLNRVDYAKQISDYDRRMLEELQELRDMVAECKAVLEREQEEQELLLEELESQKAAVDRAIRAKTQEITEYQSQIAFASGEQGEYEKQLAEQEKLLEQVERQIAAAAAARAAAEDGDGGASGFVWPCPQSRRITSGFGDREAPLPGASVYHRGIDVGASSGSAVVAAASGRVTTAAYSGSAGNYVVISHGGGVSTVYMHASALYVSEGERVSQGQKIAAVGSTGFSTGPHLHFGMIINGGYVNPLNYVN